MITIIGISFETVDSSPVKRFIVTKFLLTELPRVSCHHPTPHAVSALFILSYVQKIMAHYLIVPTPSIHELQGILYFVKI